MQIRLERIHQLPAEGVHTRQVQLRPRPAAGRAGRDAGAPLLRARREPGHAARAGRGVLPRPARGRRPRRQPGPPGLLLRAHAGRAARRHHGAHQHPAVALPQVAQPLLGQGLPEPVAAAHFDVVVEDTAAVVHA